MAEDRIVSALVENLLMVFPSGPPADEALIRKWLQEIVENDASDQAEDGIYERALERAVKEWKQKSAINSEKKPPSSNTNKVQKTSFSLFSQLDAGMWGPRITLEELQAASTPEEKLALLQKVAHVDDLVLDWKDVLPILQEGLSISTTDFCELHRKWFDQGRASMEHLPIRCDLCQNILEQIMKLVTNQWLVAGKLQTETFSEVHETLFALWQLWFDMWFDLLQEPLGHDEANGSLAKIGYQILFLMRDIDIGAGSSTIHPVHFLSLVDPMASWFQAWTIRLMPSDLVNMVQSSGIMPDLWRRASTKTKMILTEECQLRSQLLEVALKGHSLSMLRSILVCTRIQWFPSSSIWEKGQSTTPKPKDPLPLASLKSLLQKSCVLGPSGKPGNKSAISKLSQCSGVSKDQLGLLFQLFFQVGVSSTSAKVDGFNPRSLAAVCAEAIHAILLGSKSRDALASEGASCGSDSFAQMLKQCQDRIATEQEKKSFDLLLSGILDC